MSDKQPTNNYLNSQSESGHAMAWHGINYNIPSAVVDAEPMQTLAMLQQPLIFNQPSVRPDKRSPPRSACCRPQRLAMVLGIPTASKDLATTACAATNA